MFENLSLESEERRVSEPTVKVDASPEVTALVLAAWTKQQEAGEKPLGHAVGPIGEKEAVEQFHAQARAACNGNEPRLKYRRLTRVGKSKDETRAYFSVALWPEAEDKKETAPETPETDSETQEAESETAEAAPETKPQTRRGTRK